MIDDRRLLDRVPAVNPYAEMARQAPLAILICADPSLERSPGYWMLDCAAAAQNMLLAAHGLGLGAVWCGVYPRQPRIEGFRRLLGVPEEIVPHSLIVLGYPAESLLRKIVSRPIVFITMVGRDDRQGTEPWPLIADNSSRQWPPLGPPRHAWLTPLRTTLAPEHRRSLKSSSHRQRRRLAKPWRME